MEKNIRNWREIYDEIGEGLIPGCHRTGCETSCCLPKRTHPKEGASEGVVYRTTLMGEDELFFQNEIYGPLERTGVLVRSVQPLDKLKFGKAYVIDECSENESRCKLEGRKPFVCRLFPFGLTARHPVSMLCPQVPVIFENDDILDRVIRVRRMLGFNDEYEWFMKARNCILDIRARLML